MAIALLTIPVRVTASALARLVGGLSRGARSAGRARAGFRRSRFGRGLDRARSAFAAISPFDDLAAMLGPSNSTALPEEVRQAIVGGANRLRFDPGDVSLAREAALRNFQQALDFRELPDLDRQAIQENLPIVKAEISRAIYRAAFRIRQSDSFRRDINSVNQILHDEIAKAGERAQARIA